MSFLYSRERATGSWTFYDLMHFLSVFCFDTFVINKVSVNTGFSTLLEKEIRKFIKFTPNPHNRSQMLAEINDIDAMEAFIKTTSDDAFLLGMIDEHFKAMTFQVQFSRLTAQALHLLLIAEKYCLPALTQRMQTHCTTKSRGSNRFNDAFTEAIVRAAAKKWGGERVLAVVCTV